MFVPLLAQHPRLAVLILLLVLGAACVPRPSEVTELQFAMWGSRQQLKVEEQIIAAFEKAHPEVKILPMPVSQRYSEKLQAMMVGDVAPDLMMVELSYYDDWAARGVLLDVTDIAERLGTEHNDMMPVARKAFCRDGRFFALPVNAHGYVTYVNVAAVRAAGLRFPEDFEKLTWEELLAIAPMLSRRGGSQAAPTDFALLMPPPQIILFGYGATLFDNSERPSRVTADSPEMRDAFTMIRRLARMGFAVPPDVASDAGTYQLFRDGRVALYFNGRWITPEFDGTTDFEWDVVPIPGGPAGQVTMHSGTGLAISARSNHLDAARKFLEFYGSEKGAQIAWRGGRTVPVLRSLAYSEAFLNQAPPASIRRFPETMEAAAAEAAAYVPGMAELNSVLTRAFDRVLYTEQPIDEITRQLAGELNDWLRDHPPRPYPVPAS